MKPRIKKVPPVPKTNPEQHNWLCHPRGEPCPDGCDAPADPVRLRVYTRWLGIPAIDPVSLVNNEVEYE